MKSIRVGLTALVVAVGVASGQAAATTLVTGSQVAPNLNGSLILGGVTLGATVNSPTTIGANFANGWDPWGATDLNSQWLSVNGSGTLGGGSAIFNTVAPANTFSLLWGSPNFDNTLELFSGLNGFGGLVATVSFNGSFFVDGTPSGAFFGPNTTDPGFIETIVTSSFFQSAVLTNTIGGFEVANVSAANTPVPGALWLLGSVLAGAAGVSRWRKKRLALA